MTLKISCVFCSAIAVSGWPSGLRRQTQGLPSSLGEIECSGPLMWAWVRIPLLTVFFFNNDLQVFLHFGVTLSNQTVCNFFFFVSVAVCFYFFYLFYVKEIQIHWVTALMIYQDGKEYNRKFKLNIVT